MTTTTLNALNSANLRSAAPFFKPNFADIRAALPDMPAQDGVLAHVGAVAAGVAMAAVPFAGVAWLFLAN
jgi:hypothetical protein